VTGKKLYTYFTVNVGAMWKPFQYVWQQDMGVLLKRGTSVVLIVPGNVTRG
jgi:hypothetical protein